MPFRSIPRKLLEGTLNGRRSESNMKHIKHILVFFANGDNRPLRSHGGNSSLVLGWGGPSVFFVLDALISVAIHAAIPSRWLFGDLLPLRLFACDARWQTACHEQTDGTVL